MLLKYVKERWCVPCVYIGGCPNCRRSKYIETCAFYREHNIGRWKQSCNTCHYILAWWQLSPIKITHTHTQTNSIWMHGNNHSSSLLLLFVHTRANKICKCATWEKKTLSRVMSYLKRIWWRFCSIHFCGFLVVVLKIHIPSKSAVSKNSNNIIWTMITLIISYITHITNPYWIK